MKEHFVITVGREYGSGGRAIAKLVAQKLNVPFYDKELLTLAAQKSGICQEIFEHNDEKTTVSDMLPVTAGTGFGAGVGLGLQMPMNQRVFLAQFEVITNLAKEQSCVIVGRCADYILEDIPNHLNVFVYAPEEARLKNCVENLQMDPQTAKKMMRDVDAARNRYHKAYIPGWQSVFDHKDLMIDSSRFGIDGTAKILADIVRNQWG